MPRVKIKHPDPNDKTKLTLLRTLSENLIYATRIITVHDGFIVITRSDEDVDLIFRGNTHDDLKELNFKPILPPELRAKRTVIIFNTDEEILKHTEDDIAKELINENPWILGGIDNVFKIPKTRIIKITFNDTTVAKKATEQGLLGYCMSISPHTIKTDEYIPIVTCLRCYALEDHTTSKCPKPKQYKVCSECTSPDHFWYECSSNNKKCLNCDGKHRTLANSCPMRKQIKDNKRYQKRQNENKTYSTVTSNSNNATNPTTAFPSLEKDTASKMMACFLHAHFVNAANPGTYNEEINKVFKLNNLPPINLPPDPPSLVILEKTKLTDNNTTLKPEKKEQNKRKAPSLDSTQEDDAFALIHTPYEHTETLSTQTTSKNSNTQSQNIDEMPVLEQIKGTEIGLQIITKKSEGWPKEHMNLASLVKRIDSGQYKWRYNSHAYSEQEVLHFIKNNEIKLDYCWCIADDIVFDKLRCGRANEKNPPPSKTSKTSKGRHRHTSR